MDQLCQTLKREKYIKRTIKPSRRKKILSFKFSS